MNKKKRIDSLRNCTLLVVDDEEYVRNFIVAALEEFGAKPCWAGSGEEALQVLAQTEVDVVLTDMNMPQMDGLQLLARLKKDHPDIQVVIISGQEDVAAAVKAMELGANSYLRKPLQIRELIVACRRALEKKDLLVQVREKEKMQLRLQHTQKLESVGRLAAGIAHEINTPTQFIGTNIDFLEDACRDLTTFVNQVIQISTQSAPETADQINTALEELDWDFLAEEIPQALSQSKEGIHRVSSIVRAMKEFSHPGSREKEPQNVNTIIQTTVTVARNEWKYVAEVELDLAEDLPEIPLLADEIGQVILNMLVNGAHAIAEKLGENPEGEKGVISICTRALNNGVELRLADTGNGIPEKARPYVFDPFYTTKEVGQGTGQGLAITHDVITQKHGGTITFTTETGKGTEFVITLPGREES